MDKIRKRVLRLAIPAVVSNLLYTMQNIVDTMMLGRYPPPDVSLSAVGLGGMVYFLMFPLIMGLTTGGVAIIARRCGEKNYDEAKKTFSMMYTVLIIISIPIAILCILYGHYIPMLMGASPMVVQEARKYIMAVFMFYPFGVNLAVYHSAIRAAGDTKTPMYIDLIANLYNIFANYILIFGNFGFPELGVFGAGLATGTSYLLGSAVYFVLQMKNKLIVYPSLLSREPVNYAEVKKMFRIGIPAGVERGMWSIASIFYTTLTIAVGGTLGYAAFQVGLRAESLAYMPGFGFSIAATTLVGQYLGEGSERKAERAAIEAAKMCALFMGIIGGVMVVFPSYLASVFTSDPDIVALASIYLFLMGFTEPALGALFTLAGGMRGAGYTKMPMVINFTGLIVIRLSIAVIFAYPLGMGLIGVWLGMFVETFVRAGWMYAEFKRGKWKMVKV